MYYYLRFYTKQREVKLGLESEPRGNHERNEHLRLELVRATSYAQVRIVLDSSETDPKWRT